MDASQDFKSLQEKIQGALVGTTKSANRIANEDLSFQRTANPSVGDRLDDQTERLLSLASGLLQSAGKATDQSAPSSFDDAEDVDIQWRGIVDVIDSLLEKADTCLDEYTGLVKRKVAPVADAGSKPKKSKTNDRLDYNIRRANIVKPQNAFERRPDNFHKGPWKPLLSQKPHALVPLEESLGTFTDENETTQFKHPYETEVLKLQYPPTVYEKREPIPYLPAEDTAATWVDTYEGVLAMLEELKKAKEIAVDLEHHDFRTYNGLLSLMQISTREKDWIVDTLKPWRHQLEILNEVFADPSIVKVFHGAFMDIVWLQRDLGLYVVGLFDTFHASSALNYPGRSLAYLLQKFADFEADKKYQMADWRIRPLPDEMLYYARSDTHYLLYIYDMLRNELVEKSDPTDPEKNLVEFVLQKSKEVSLLRYEGLTADPSTGQGPRGWFNPLTKTPSAFSSEQFAVYRAVHKWRDDLARREDENPQFIMPQHVMTDIAKIMPSDPKALWSLFRESAQIVRRSVDELFAIIQKAKAEGVNGPTMVDFFRGDTMGSIASHLAATKNKASDEELPAAKELRSENSQLWGTVPLSSVWDQTSRGTAASDNVQIAVPWSNFVQGLRAAVPDTPPEPKAEKEDPDVDMLPLETSVPDTEFTLRAGRKRKVEETLETSQEFPGSGSNEDSGDDARTDAAKDVDDVEGSASKISLKGNRKQRKRDKKNANSKAKKKNGEIEIIDDEEDNEEPFDYSKAQSVLHAQRANNGPTTRTFDPYRAKMTAEGPKAARRMQHEKAGKSATFKK